MNPGYAGRAELPENLKALFRGVRDGGARLCEHHARSSCARRASSRRRCSRTSSSRSSQLNKELLSKQDHYDWGLRAIKGVLRIAGGMKRAGPTSSEARS